MYTIGPTDPCPIAAFDTNATIGSAPFSVQFTDASLLSPSTWTWDFGDGNSSREQNPTHTYYNQGTFTVNLIVSTPYCRDGISSSNLIHVGTPPVAAFSGTPVSGFAPVDVSFTDESSGSPTEWLWDFGDGFVSTDKNPTHQYSNGGSYDVTLTVNNTYGLDTIEKIRYISALTRTGTIVTTAIAGLDVTTNQTVALNTSKFPDFALTNGNTTLWFIPPPENGIKEMTLFAEGGFSESGGILTGTLTRVILRSENIPLTGFSPQVGTDCSLWYELNMSSYPTNAQIAAAKWEGYIPSDYDYFLQTIYHAGFAGIVGVAYEVQFQKTNLNVPHNATLYLTVNSSWVESHGTHNRTWVLRIGDDLRGEVLPTTYSHTNVTENLDYFVADSPRGLSKFALTGLHGSGNPLQIIVLIIQQVFNPGADSSDEGVPTFTPTRTPTPTPSVVPTTTLPTGGGAGILTYDEEGVLSENFEVEDENRMVKISVPKGTTARNADGSPVENISIQLLGSEVLPSIPSDLHFEGIAYELGPEGATFDQSVIVTLTIPANIWSPSKQFSLRVYNDSSMRWEEISTTSTTDPHTLSVQLDHLSIIGLFSDEVPVTASPTSPTTSPPITQTPISFLISLFAVGIGMVWCIRRRR
jgi:FOG: PKD repeat